MTASLRTRVIALVLLIAALATSASAWLLIAQAQRTMREQTQRSLGDTAAIFDQLVTYGVSHPDWSEVGPLVGKLSSQYDVRIALRTETEQEIADSDRVAGRTPRALPKRPWAVVDPAQPSFITANSGMTDAQAKLLTSCADQAGIESSTIEVDGVKVPMPKSQLTPQLARAWMKCLEQDPSFAATVTPPKLVAECLHEAGFATHRQYGALVPVETTPESMEASIRCDEQVRRSLDAPPALLFLGTASSIGPFVRGVAWPAVLGIVGVVLAIATILAWWLSRVLTNPLTQLAAAAGRLEAGDLTQRVGDRGQDEVARTGRAFNSLAASLQRNEAARQRLISDIAHELGNPLVTIGGTLEAIQDGLYAASPEVVASLSEETDHVSRLVKDLQELARADAGRLSLTTREVDLAEVVLSVVEGNRGVAGALGVELAADVPATLSAQVDPDRIRQIMGNLISNALRHTGRGGSVTVTVSGTAEEARITVADTGEGIAGDDLPHVFDRFWRADTSRSRATGGSGLGLAIVAELVEAHGGTITVDSVLGQGTRFEVVLPGEPVKPLRS
ncbi:MAG: HAMP domain-containing sensor histidine kinase [Nocardioides sp.]